MSNLRAEHEIRYIFSPLCRNTLFNKLKFALAAIYIGFRGKGIFSVF